MTTTMKTRIEPVLKLNFYSHATLECRDIKATRRFFEEFLGFETVQMADVSFWARMGGDQVIVVIQGRKTADKMHFLNHNGLDVATEAEVDAAYAIVEEQAERWGIQKISKRMVVHGTYSFYFWDQDGNAWEILSNPHGGYSWGFALGDQAGRGHNDPNFSRPTSTLRDANDTDH